MDVVDFEDNGFKIKEIKERKRVFGCLKIKKKKRREREREWAWGEKKREKGRVLMV